MGTLLSSCDEKNVIKLWKVVGAKWEVISEIY